MELLSVYSPLLIPYKIIRLRVAACDSVYEAVFVEAGVKHHASVNHCAAI